MKAFRPARKGWVGKGKKDAFVKVFAVFGSFRPAKGWFAYLRL